ncbi:unnamed protein product [Discosporangium mesarthrocarpum]
MKPATDSGERYKKLMTEEVIPALKVRMPRPPGHASSVQEDGAKLHSGKGVMEAIQDAAGEDIILESQPANSPDFNVNDHGFSRSIQQLKEDVGVTSIFGDDIVVVVVVVVVVVIVNIILSLFVLLFVLL